MLLLIGILGQHRTDVAGCKGAFSVIMQTPTPAIFRKDWGDLSERCMEM